MAAISHNSQLKNSKVLSVTICEMKRRHLRSVIRIENKVFPRPWTVGLFMSELSMTTGRAYFVAKANSKIVGYCGMIFSCGQAHITNVAVDPEWQRQHIASRLMIQLVRSAITQGISDMTLEVRMSNRSAQSLYYRFGFAPGGVRKNYYPETNEDALIMWARGIDTHNYRLRVEANQARITGSTIWADSTNNV